MQRSDPCFQEQSQKNYFSSRSSTTIPFWQQHSVGHFGLRHASPLYLPQRMSPVEFSQLSTTSLQQRFGTSASHLYTGYCRPRFQILKPRTPWNELA